jgi:endonuclease YncB( thermonuclease family)
MSSGEAAKRSARSGQLVLVTAIHALCLAVAAPAVAATLEGRVVQVLDGDELILLVGERRLHVRLAHIEAPEQGRPYSIVARQSLSAVCGGELAKAHVSGKDRLGRTVAHVSCAGTDAGAEQVRRGMARVMAPAESADAVLASAQSEARAARRGLWAQSYTAHDLK